jgi:hypothetical protein
MGSVIRIEDVRDVPSADMKRVGKMDKQVVYRVDGVRQYWFNMPDDEYTPEKAMERIKTDEKDRQKIIGQTFAV